MAEYHITLKGSRVFLLLLGGVAVIGLVAVAVLLYLFLAFEPLEMLQFRVKLQGQPFNARLSGSLPIDAQIDQVLRIPVKQNIPVRVPFDQQFTIPFDKALTIPIEMDTSVPISLTVPFKSEILVDSQIYIDTKVQTTFLGIPFDVPIKGYLPVRMKIPVDEEIPVHETIRVKVRTPVKAYVKEAIQVPLHTTIATEVPVDTELDIPIKGNIHADASMDGQLPNLFLLDNTVDIRMNQLRVIWRDSSSQTADADPEPVND